MKNLELNALRLESSARSNESNVVNSVLNSGIASLCYAYKSRVKPEQKLIEKVQRKLKDKPDYKVDQITDVIGLRLITLFRNEIPKVLEEVLRLIKHENALNPNPFKADSFEEVIIFTNSPAYDPFLSDLQNIIKTRGVPCQVIPSKEGYSSVHIVARLQTVARLRSASDVEVEHFLPVEIQIRSVFEDAWGEIDHRFGYVVRAGKTNEDLIHNSSLVQPHLKVLKQFTDACAQYADTIYISAHTPVSVKDTSGKIASVPSDDEVLRRFANLGVPEAYRQRYIEGRALREGALSMVSTSRIAGQSECLKAAAYFLSLHQTASADLNETTGRALYLFYARMNEALCLLSTDSPQHVKSAELMYLQLREEYPEFILVRFRLAQALARLGRTDESIVLFHETKTALITAASRNIGKKDWPDEIPETDYLHMLSLLPKLLGYQYWKKSEESETIEQRMTCFLNAHDVTKEGMSESKEQANIQNNLVYYAMEYLSLAEGKPNSITKRLATSLHTNLAQMEVNLKKTEEKFDISTLDTMMEAYNFLGRIDLAQKMATKILQSVKTAHDGDAEEILNITKTALHVQSLQAASKPARGA
jgi:ppGpp synthetase/RelA/SpoT-type nucleotidyltranferase